MFRELLPLLIPVGMVCVFLLGIILFGIFVQLIDRRPYTHGWEVRSFGFAGALRVYESGKSKSQEEALIEAQISAGYHSKFGSIHRDLGIVAYVGPIVEPDTKEVPRDSTTGLPVTWKPTVLKQLYS